MTATQLRAQIRNLRTVETTYLNDGYPEAADVARRARRAARLQLRTLTGARRRSI